MTAKELDEIEAQIDDTVPYYVPRLIQAVRQAGSSSLLGRTPGEEQTEDQSRGGKQAMSPRQDLPQPATGDLCAPDKIRQFCEGVVQATTSYSEGWRDVCQRVLHLESERDQLLAYVDAMRDSEVVKEYKLVVSRLVETSAQRDELLEAAKATLQYWEVTGFAECDPDCDCIVEATRAAIAKAEGR